MMLIIICIFGLILGIKLGKFLRVGLIVGVGFIGFNIIIVLLIDNLGLVI